MKEGVNVGSDVWEAISRMHRKCPAVFRDGCLTQMTSNFSLKPSVFCVQNVNICVLQRVLVLYPPQSMGP